MKVNNCLSKAVLVGLSVVSWVSGLAAGTARRGGRAYSDCYWPVFCSGTKQIRPFPNPLFQSVTWNTCLKGEWKPVDPQDLELGTYCGVIDPAGSAWGKCSATAPMSTWVNAASTGGEVDGTCSQ